MPTKSNSPVAALLTIEQVAAILQCSTKTIRRRVAAGTLPAIRNGGVVRIDPRDLTKFIASHRTARR